MRNWMTSVPAVVWWCWLLANHFPVLVVVEGFVVVMENNKNYCPKKDSTRLKSSSQEEEKEEQKEKFYYPHDATLSDQTFQELYRDDLPDWLMDKCQEWGFIHPTLIQERALDCFFCKNNDNENQAQQPPNSLVIQAQTGSGKTLTYLLPLLAHLEHRAAIQAMIVVPTRELGLQVAQVAKRLAGRKFMVMSLLQGSALKRQRAWAWAETPQVVIGTPPELLDMVQYGGLPRINSIQYVVVDEVDACLVHKSGTSLNAATTTTGPKNNNHGDDKTLSTSLHILLSKYLSPTYAVDDDGTSSSFGDPRDLVFTSASAGGGGGGGKRPKRRFRHRQTVFASATIPQHRHFLKQCKANQWTLEEPVYICANPGEAMPPTLDHAYVVCASQDKKVATLRRLLSKKILIITKKKQDDDESSWRPSPKQVLIFCEPSRPMNEIAMILAHDLNGRFYQEGQDSNNNNNNNSIGSGNKYSKHYNRAPSEDVFVVVEDDGDDHNGDDDDDDDDDGDEDEPLVSVLRMEDSLSMRAGATKAFQSGGGKAGNIRIMLTTDLAARGLDMAAITHVVHFDVPPDGDTYLHRSGRAGRLGRQGQVISIITSDQEFVLERLANSLNIADKLQCIGRQQSSVKKKKNKKSTTELL